MKFVRYSVLSVLFLCSFALLAQAQWVKKANIPLGGTDAAMSFAVDGKIYFGGGTLPTNAFYEYDPATDKWTRKADLPIVHSIRAFGVSFAVGSKGYVALGQSDTSISFASQQGSVTNDLWEYDPTANTWTQKANFPGVRRDGAMAFVIGDKAYVGAGVGPDFFYAGDFFEYDPASDKWTQKSDLPSGPIGFPMGFSIGSMGYMVGGGNPNEVTDAWSYDPAKDEWNEIRTFPGDARQAGAAFALDSLGYVGLGEAQYTKSFSDIYSYYPKTDEWTKVRPNFPYALGVGWPAVAVIGSTAYIGSGADQNFSFKDFWYAYSAASEPPLTAVTLLMPANNTTISDTAIDFSWEPVATATGYHIELAQTPDFAGQLFEDIVTTPTFHVPTFLPGTFYWRVAAKRSDVEGPWSEVRSFTEVEASVASIRSNTSKAYPNPAHYLLHIAAIGAVRVYDALGREVSIAQSNGMLNISALAPGAYRYTVASQLGMVSGSFMKE